MNSNITGAEVLAGFSDGVLDIVREAAHDSRRYLVNLYVGDDRSEKIARVDQTIGLIEEEQAKRAGLMSSDDILAALLPGGEDLTLSVEEATDLPRPEDSSYQVGQRIICTLLPHIGATVRSLDNTGVGLDYDTDSDEERGAYSARYATIRPMPRH